MNLRGLSSLAPSEAPFLGTRGGKGVSWLLVLGCCVFPFKFVLFCGFTRFTRRPSQWLDLRQARGARRPPLARVRARGSPSEGGGLVPSCFGIWLPYFVGRGSQGPRALLSGMGAFFVPPHRPFFSHALVSVSPPQVFFFCVAGPRGPGWIARRHCEIIITWPSGPQTECQTILLVMRNSERGSENTPELSECYAEIQALNNPPPLLRFLFDSGENAVRFFPAMCFGKSL